MGRATLSPVQMRHYTEGEARSAFSPTGHDNFFKASVAGSRFVSRLTTEVKLPESLPLPTDRPVLIAANHSSMLDLPAALILLGHFGLTTAIGVNSRYFKGPVGPFFRKLGCIPFSREDHESAEDAMVAALVDNQTCAIMPEGKVVREKDRVDGLVGGGRPGVSRIARRAGAAVLPIGFAHSDTAWPPGTSLPRVRNRKQPIIGTAGALLWFDSDDHEANAAEVMASISACVATGRAASLNP